MVTCLLGGCFMKRSAELCTENSQLGQYLSAAYSWGRLDQALVAVTEMSCEFFAVVVQWGGFTSVLWFLKVGNERHLGQTSLRLERNPFTDCPKDPGKVISLSFQLNSPYHFKCCYLVWSLFRVHYTGECARQLSGLGNKQNFRANRKFAKGKKSLVVVD